MNKRLWVLAFTLSMVMSVPVLAARPPDYANDLGPDSIDASGYPVPMQKNYQLFLRKCSFCHTAARAVNSEFVEPKQWSRYVLRMQMRPPCCNRCPVISHDEAKAIYQFLVYDSQVRKTGPQADSWAQGRAALLAQFKIRYPKMYEQRYGKKGRPKKETP